MTAFALVVSKRAGRPGMLWDWSCVRQRVKEAWCAHYFCPPQACAQDAEEVASCVSGWVARVLCGWKGIGSGWVFGRGWGGGAEGIDGPQLTQWLPAGRTVVVPRGHRLGMSLRGNQIIAAGVSIGKPRGGERGPTPCLLRILRWGLVVVGATRPTIVRWGRRCFVLRDAARSSRSPALAADVGAWSSRAVWPGACWPGRTLDRRAA